MFGREGWLAGWGVAGMLTPGFCAWPRLLESGFDGYAPDLEDYVDFCEGHDIEMDPFTNHDVTVASDLVAWCCRAEMLARSLQALRGSENRRGDL